MITIPGSIPIHISPYFWILLVVIGFLNTETVLGTAIWAGVIFISVLLHEFGHALTSVAFGQKAEISLEGMGGVTRRQGATLPKWKDFIIVLNGPVVGFILYFIASYLSEYTNLASNVVSEQIFKVFMIVNLFWTVLNLLPVMPLDGGQLFRIFLEGVFGLKGMKIAFIFSLIFGFLVGIGFFMIGQIFIGALFMMLGFENYRAWEQVKEMSDADRNPSLMGLIDEAKKEMSVGHDEEAMEKIRKVREEAPKGMLYVEATELGAYLLSKKGTYKQAYDWLLPLHARISIESLFLLQQLAFRLEEWEEAVKIGRDLFFKQPSSESAVLNALSYGIMGQAKESAGWLQSAKELGVDHFELLLRKREFDAVRDSPYFAPFEKKDV